MADQPIDAEPINVPLEHVGLDDTPLIFANQFLAQVQQDEFLLIVGQVAPPIVTGTRAEQLEQLRAITSVKSHVIARYVLTRTRLDELIATLEDIRQKADAQRRGELQ